MLTAVAVPLITVFLRQPRCCFRKVTRVAVGLLYFRFLSARIIDLMSVGGDWVLGCCIVYSSKDLPKWLLSPSRRWVAVNTSATSVSLCYTTPRLRIWIPKAYQLNEKKYGSFFLLLQSFLRPHKELVRYFFLPHEWMKFLKSFSGSFHA